MKKIQINGATKFLVLVISVVDLIVGGLSALQSGSIISYTALFIFFLIVLALSFSSETFEDSESERRLVNLENESSECAKRLNKLEGDVLILNQKCDELLKQIQKQEKTLS